MEPPVNIPWNLRFYKRSAAQVRHREKLLRELAVRLQVMSFTLRTCKMLMRPDIHASLADDVGVLMELNARYRHSTKNPQPRKKQNGPALSATAAI